MMRFKRQTTKFEFKDTTTTTTESTRRKHKTHELDDGTAGSLSYSAASNSSMASNDDSSSFCAFRRVLEGKEELASYVKTHVKKDADSLAYSTDVDTRATYESHLQGASLVSGGRSSSSNPSVSIHPYASALGASYLNNGGGQQEPCCDHFIEDESIQRRRDRKRRDRVVPDCRTPTRKQNTEEETADEDEVWYSKWWMLCFPDILQR